MTKALMFQGTGSDVGKTVLVAGLCRLASNRGIRVAPFKPQNMSNNAAISDDGGEIGRGQWLQALASRVPSSVHMNPVLLKPQSEMGSQVIVQGKVWGEAKAREYKKIRSELMDAVLESYKKISDEADLVLVEGAGSPAEINLRDGDIANMGFATSAGVPVILIGDIDRGGVIASLVGTHHILPERDLQMIAGYLINKFRGDVSLFDDGITSINGFTNWRCFGVVPWLKSAGKLPAEDSVILDRLSQTKEAGFKIVVPRLPRIANFDDLDPLVAEPNIDVQFIDIEQEISDDVDLIVLPGTKSTIADLTALEQAGWRAKLGAHIERGGSVIGICGGYQMLGRKIYDPDHIESAQEEINGFGLLDIVTYMEPEKVTRNVKSRVCPFDVDIEGYEIHVGRTNGSDCQRPFSIIEGRHDGAISNDGRVMGTYLHGLFTSDAFRSAFLNSFGLENTSVKYSDLIDDALNELAEELDKHVDFDALLSIK